MRKLLLVLIAIALALTGCESKSTIVHGLDEQDANEIMVLLAKDHIPAYKLAQAAGGPGGGQKAVLWDIAVTSQDRLQAMAVLSANGLPRKQSPNLLELFSASGLVPSDTSQQIRYEAGLATSLANTIRKIDGVLDVDVIISFPEENPLSVSEKTSPVTATVFVKHNGILDDPNSQLISQIKQLVSSSVPKLSYNNVTVIGDRARFSLPSTSFAPSTPKEYYRVWDFVLAQSSLRKFQVVLFLLCLLIFILFLGILWLAWKMYPLAKKAGGIGSLFTFKPLPDKEESEEVKSAEEAKPEEEKPLEESKKPPVQENVEE